MNTPIDNDAYRISVVIPAFNAESCIERAIRSVLAQSYPVHEIIVVDDGSDDHTADVVQSFDAPVRYLRQETAGPGAARNAAIGAATGNWIAFLDADDEWLPEKLTLQVELLRAHPDLHWCGANCFNENGPRRTYRSDPKKAQTGLGNREYFDNYLTAKGNGHIYEATITLLIRREVFDELGLFDTELLRAEDSHMWCRIAFRHPKFGYLPEPLAIVHLDVRNPLLTQRRLFAKRGVYFRQMINKLLPIAAQSGCQDAFNIYARSILRNTLLRAIFHGHKQDARDTAKMFRQIIPWHWRIGTYLFTFFPRITSGAARTVAFLILLVKMEKRVSRRWTHNKEAAE